MKRQYINAVKYAKEALKDPKLKAEYDRLQPEFALIRAILDARIKRGITQKRLASRLKTKQSVISRLETGRGNPTLSFLQRLATAFDSRLEIHFRPLAN